MPSDELTSVPFIVPKYHFLSPDPVVKEESGTEVKFYSGTLYHYTSLDTAKLIITGNKLNFSPPAIFNDPFDMYEGLINFSTQSKESIKFYETIINGFKSLSGKSKQNVAERAAKEILLEMKNEVGVCCFSKKNNVSLMWSHYANKHQGVCLGFDISPVHLSENMYFSVAEVNYLKSISAYKWNGMEDGFLLHYLYTKSHIWSYEEEVRAIIKNRQENRLFDFDKDCLREVFFGCRTTSQEIKEIMSLLKSHGYNVKVKKRMMIDDSIFDIRPVNI